MSSLTPWRDLHGRAFADVTAMVTGGAGFIGSHLVEALIDLGAHVTVIDDLSGSDEANLAPMRQAAPDRLRFIEGSILDSSLLRQITAGVRFVFHQAALGSVPRSVAEPRAFHEVNTNGSLNVLEAAREAGVQRVMFAASSSAYGESPVLPKLETMAPLPKSPYAASKVAGEAMMQAWAGSYSLDTVCLRYFNIFGPRQNANSAYAAVIAAFAKALLAGQRPTIFGDGEQSRDFTFVDNAVHANLLAARCKHRLDGQVLNVACGQRISVNQLAAAMAELLGRSDLQPTRLDERAGDVKHSLAELSRIQQLLDYQPVVDFPAGLEATLQWYRAEPV